MTEMQMCPETKTGVKTTAQEMYYSIYNRINEVNNTMKKSTLKECSGFEIKKNDGLYYGDNFLFEFIPEEILKNLYGQYLTLDTVNNGKLVVKFGEALRESVFERYNSVTCAKKLRSQVIAVWPCDKKDTETLRDIRSAIGTPNIGFEKYESYC